MSHNENVIIMFYRTTFPNEVLVAACSGFKTHGFDPRITAEDLTPYKNITAVFLSDYCWQPGGDLLPDFKTIGDNNNIEFQHWKGTRAYVRSRGSDFLGNWINFEDSGTPAYYAHQCAKTLDLQQQYRVYHESVSCSPEAFAEMAGRGEAFVEKETSQGEYAARNAVLLSVPDLGLCAFTSLGGSSGVHKTHEGVEKFYPSAKFSFLHTYRADKQYLLLNNWSVRDLRSGGGGVGSGNEIGPPDWVFPELLQCASFATAGKQRGGSGGLSFDQVVLKVFSMIESQSRKEKEKEKEEGTQDV